MSKPMPKSVSCANFGKQKDMTLNFLFLVFIASVIIWFVIYLLPVSIVAIPLNFILMGLMFVGIVLLILWKIKSKQCK